MRFVSIEKLKAGMALAKPLLESNLETLMKEGTELDDAMIHRINAEGYLGVYVEDAISRGVEVQDILRAQTRMQTIQQLKAVLKEVRAKAAAGEELAGTKHPREIVMPVIEEVFFSPKRLVELLDVRPYDDYDDYHTANMVTLAILVGVEMGLSGTQLQDLGIAALLHDVATVFTPTAILEKQGEWNEEERQTAKDGAQRCFEFLRQQFEISPESCAAVLQVHENYDGTGWPNQLAGDQISLYGKILAVVHGYDELVSRRPGRAAQMPDSALQHIRRNAGVCFDPKVVRLFSRVVAPYPAGSLLELADGRHALVLENFSENIARPRLMLTDGSDTVFDLCHDESARDIEISKVIG
jgi:HD-GYP domain